MGVVRAIATLPAASPRKPSPRPDDQPHHHKYDDDSCQNAKHVCCYPATASGRGVQEAVDVEALRRSGDVCKTDVEGEDEDEEDEVQPGHWVGGGQDDLEQCEERVQPVS